MTDIRIRELIDTDYSALASFNSTFQDDKLSTEQWQAKFYHWWDDNPAYDGNWKRGFLLLDGARIVGWVGSFPTYFYAMGQVITAFNGTTWRVLPEYRQWSIDLWTYNREVSKHYLSFNTTPIDEIIPLIRKLKYFQYPWGEEKVSYLITDSRQFVRFYLGKPWFRLAIALAPIVWAVQRFTLKLTPNGMRVVSGLPSEADLDSLWEATRSRISYTNVRDSRVVRWYADNRTVLGVYDERGLAACAVFGSLGHNRHKGKEVHLMDIWFKNADCMYPALQAIICASVQLAKREKAVMIRFPHCSKSMSRLLDQTGMRTIHQSHLGFVKLGKGQDFVFTHENSWFTRLQGDYGC
jgi:hypothetical protein